MTESISNEATKLIDLEIVLLGPDHSDILQGVFEKVRTNGDDLHFSPHPFTDEHAKEICEAKTLWDTRRQVKRRYFIKNSDLKNSPHFLHREILWNNP